MKNIKILIVLLCIFIISGCGTDTTSGTIDGIKFEETTKVTEHIKIAMNSGDVIIIELLPEYAPITVENFQKLVSEEFYNGLTFHRISKDFVIQGGDPLGNGSGGSDENIKGEFEDNDVENDLKHEKGVVSMARSNDYDSASSQFFICLSDMTCPQLDGSYAAFGNVIAGMDTVEKIGEAPVNTGTETPQQKQIMKDVTFVNISEEN